MKFLQVIVIIRTLSHSPNRVRIIMIGVPEAEYRNTGEIKLHIL